MSRSNAQHTVLRGRRGCLFWLPILLLLLVIGIGGSVYGEQIQSNWIAITQQVATSTPVPTPDYAGLVRGFRRAEEAALATTLNSNNPEVLAALPIFAAGNALAQVQNEVQHLRDRQQFQHVILEELEIVQPILEYPTAKLLTRERHRIQTFTRKPSGDVMTDKQYFDAEIAYQLAYDGQRWRVEKAVIATREDVPE